MLRINNNKLKILAIISIILGQILMITLFVNQTKVWNLLSYVKIFGILIGSVYAYSMFINKAKLMGICAFIFNMVTAYVMFESKLWGLFSIRLYGIFMGLYLTIFGNDNYQHTSSYISEVKKLIVILIFTIIFYFLNGISKVNYLTICLDLLAVIALTFSLYFHANQSRKQFHFWFASNILNLVLGLLKSNPYLIGVFAFWAYMDNLSWLNWYQENKNNKFYESDDLLD